MHELDSTRSGKKLVRRSFSQRKSPIIELNRTCRSPVRERGNLELFVQDLVNPYLAGVAGFFERNPKALGDPSVNHSA